MNKRKLMMLIAALTSISLLCVACVIFLQPFKKTNNGGTSSKDPDNKKEAYFTNPVKNINFPDPYVYKHTDGYYYGMATTGSNLLLYKSANLTNLFTTGQSKIIWTPPEGGDFSRDIWAPEIYYIDGSWYIYYSAGNGDINQRTLCISNSNDDPFEGTWTDNGKIYVQGADFWAIDGTILQQNGNLYFIFSGWDPNTGGTQHIYIAKMSSPTKITGWRVKLSSPEYEWERKVNVDGEPWVNEGPQILKKNGKTFIIYSASFCHSPYYCLGQLTCDSNADPMIASNWEKSKTPVFQSGNGIYGPGHCSFTTSPDNSEDWIIYHARTSTNPDETRKVSMQKFTWNSDGTPNFGTPVSYGTAIEVPSGQTGDEIIINSKTTYRLKNKQTNLYLDTTDSSKRNGTVIIQMDDNDSVSQRWELIDCYDGSFKLLVSGSNKCLDNPSGLKNSGAKMQLWTDNGADAQRWYIIDLGDGYCKLINKASGLVLSATEESKDPGAFVIQADDNNSPLQRWKLE